MTARELATRVLAAIFLVGFLSNMVTVVLDVMEQRPLWGAFRLCGAVGCWVAMRFAWDVAGTYKEERS